MADDDDCCCDDDDDKDTAKRDRELNKHLKTTGERSRELTTEAKAFSKAITGAFTQAVTGAKSFDTVLKSLGLKLSSLAVNMAMKPITNALTGGFEKLLGGSSGTGLTTNLFSSDKGEITGFAKGGVIAAPTYFPLGAGGLGVAGEAGAEAIMPLARGPDGRLGVAAAGSAGGNVTVNIATPDADSFRRSETYLTGLIARAVARGQRGM